MLILVDNVVCADISYHRAINPSNDVNGTPAHKFGANLLWRWKNDGRPRVPNQYHDTQKKQTLMVPAIESERHTARLFETAVKTDRDSIESEAAMLTEDGKLLIAKSDIPVYLEPAMANRHGLIAGATGTGKTVTLKTITQAMSDIGVPCFLADIKGDVTGMAVPGDGNEKLLARLAELGIDNPQFYGSPVRFWDVFGEGGLNVRTTVSEMGPMLLSRLLGLTEVQEGVLNIAFHIADDEGLLLLDLKDLRAMLGYVGEHADEYTLTYGNVTGQSIGAIQRALLKLEDAGGNDFFGEPALDIRDWFACDSSGKGYVNILDCVKLANSPQMYSTFLLWMLSELYESLPEVGDLDKPKICFFFDEAHMLFTDAAPALVEKVEQVVKLIRSKGVGVWFITQNPADIPNSVLAQLGNRVQHALRAYTPHERKAIKAAAESFRENPAFDTEQAIEELATGEALVSFLDEEGIPGVVQRAKVIAPSCSMDAAPAEVVQRCIQDDVLLNKYAEDIDRESAYELLLAAAEAALRDAEEAKAAAEQAKEEAKLAKEQAKAEEKAAKEAERAAAKEERDKKRAIKSVGNSVVGTVGRELGKSIGGKFGKFGRTLGGNTGASLARGLFGNLFK